jgi:ribose-phosphate pyrophosphokinase
MTGAKHHKAVYGFPECETQARALAEALRCPYFLVGLHTFPDRESLVRIEQGADDAILFRPLHHPNAKIFEVIQAASALRGLGAERITLVAPYLPYMRQDKVFHPGEALSQKVFSDVIIPWIDGLITVEPHLHRSRTMKSVFPGLEGIALSGALPLADYFRDRGIEKNTLVIGPDEEAHHIARPFAERLGLEWTTALKKRSGDRNVKVILEGAALEGRPVLIIDDVISTGMTVIGCARAALEAGAASVSAAVVHALYDEQAAKAFKAAGIAPVVSTDSIPHPSSHIALAPYLAEVLS